MKWVDNNGLRLNAKKTQFLLLGRQRRQARVSMGEEAVERSKSVNCLGVQLEN